MPAEILVVVVVVDAAVVIPSTAGVAEGDPVGSAAVADGMAAVVLVDAMVSEEVVDSFAKLVELSLSLLLAIVVLSKVPTCPPSFTIVVGPATVLALLLVVEDVPVSVLTVGFVCSSPFIFVVLLAATESFTDVVMAGVALVFTVDVVVVPATEEADDETTVASVVVVVTVVVV